MKLINVAAIKAGSGATTVAVNLATALHQKGQPVLLMDCCPSNALRLHCAMEWQNTTGWMPLYQQQKPWYEACYRSQEGVLFLPFGEVNGENAGQDLNTFLQHVNIIDAFQQLDLDPNTWLILDNPSQLHNIQTALQAPTDLTINVMTVDPASYAQLRRMDLGNKDVVLLNRFNPLLRLESDINDVIQNDYPNDVLPHHCYQDESIREALAFKQSVLSCAPQSRAAYDYNTLATWLKTQLCDTP